ncbi:hypothetical protein ACVU7I_12635 [Patulibacter sp. S7RM1-6]
MVSVLTALVALWIGFNALFLAAAVASSVRMGRQAAALGQAAPGPGSAPVLPLPAF